ncbi:peptidoglycan/xylan/chitin deacetylase (PgdA/CDA1 family) [Paenibacillus castaneae]|uniref:polysaccharide deacetylase family protein n=1 Tax=Paenibacillus castaneae TaxID=474957 RepID=UPI000C9C97B5|nr:polysaccharide deacetylase family protein [Paenibacillus castaneae]NIK78267.1 peptidoglycan/xylan/chitin deacetylase (PgdA/CDA1 family) [Paenibacillus castaneae]
MLAVEKTVSLTIDAGPAGDFIQKVDYLNEKGMTAVWFCLGEALESEAEKAVYAVKHGHQIGNRGYKDADFSELSLDEAREQIELADRLVEQIYRSAAVSRPSKLFRYPEIGDEISDEHLAGLQLVLEELGYVQVSSTLDTFDIGMSLVPGTVKDLDSSIQDEIIQIHDWIPTGPFKALIDKLIEAGFICKLPA